MVQIGAGHNHLPLVFVRDVAEGMIQAAESRKAAGRAYLLVSAERVTQRQYLEAIAAELGVAAPSLRIPYRAALALGAVAECAGHALRRAGAPPLTRYGVQMLGGDNQFIVARAGWDFGFSAKTSMLDGVRQSVSWYQATHNTRPTSKEDFEYVGTRHRSNWSAGQASHPSPAGAGPERQRAGAAR
jgi:dihydroflavonol-4-reductase